jgi:hypothetical protein
MSPCYCGAISREPEDSRRIPFADGDRVIPKVPPDRDELEFSSRRRTDRSPPALIVLGSSGQTETRFPDAGVNNAAAKTMRKTVMVVLEEAASSG